MATCGYHCKYSAGPVDGLGTCYSPPSRSVAPGCPTVASACNKEYNDILRIHIKPLDDYNKNRTPRFSYTVLFISEENMIPKLAMNQLSTYTLHIILK
jgi:hypothetical protein